MVGRLRRRHAPDVCALRCARSGFLKALYAHVAYKARVKLYARTADANMFALTVIGAHAALAANVFDPNLCSNPTCNRDDPTYQCDFWQCPSRSDVKKECKDRTNKVVTCAKKEMFCDWRIGGTVTNNNMKTVAEVWTDDYNECKDDNGNKPGATSKKCFVNTVGSASTAYNFCRNTKEGDIACMDDTTGTGNSGYKGIDKIEYSSNDVTETSPLLEQTSQGQQDCVKHGDEITVYIFKSNEATHVSLYIKEEITLTEIAALAQGTVAAPAAHGTTEQKYWCDGCKPFSPRLMDDVFKAVGEFHSESASYYKNADQKETGQKAGVQQKWGNPETWKFHEIINGFNYIVNEPLVHAFLCKFEAFARETEVVIPQGTYCADDGNGQYDKYHNNPGDNVKYFNLSVAERVAQGGDDNAKKTFYDGGLIPEMSYNASDTRMSAEMLFMDDEFRYVVAARAVPDDHSDFGDKLESIHADVKGTKDNSEDSNTHNIVIISLVSVGLGLAVIGGGVIYGYRKYMSSGEKVNTLL